ncbi:MAG: hypothetical protein ACRCXA_08010 [Peptostreptococcaceae bacterium]
MRVWSGTKQTINYTVEEIKMYLMLEESYPQYANLKRRVILPAIKELNETGYFEIDIKENKVGRKIEYIDFIVNDLEVFVPDETLFTKGTLRSFKKDFKETDFKNKYMEKAFDDAVMVTLDRDDVENIKATSYKFFKSTLDNKIDEYKLEEEKDIEHKKNLDMYW